MILLLRVSFDCRVMSIANRTDAGLDKSAEVNSSSAR